MIRFLHEHLPQQRVIKVTLDLNLNPVVILTYSGDHSVSEFH